MAEDADWQWEALDEEFKLLLAAVNSELQQRGEPHMSQLELNAAIRSLLRYRDEGNARFAISQAVKCVQNVRKASGGGAALQAGAVTAAAVTRP